MRDIVDWDENVVDDTSSVFQLTNAVVKYNCLIWLLHYMYEGAPVIYQMRGEVVLGPTFIDWIWTCDFVVTLSNLILQAGFT